MSPFTTGLFEEMDRLRQDIDRVLGNGGSLGRGWPVSRSSFLPARAARAYPLVNVTENADGYRIQALAPGLDPDSLNISVQRNQLVISGRKRALPETVTPERVHRNERASGQFTRALNLPGEIDANQVSAEYRDGLLHIDLPRAEEARPRPIEVKVG